MVNSKNKLLKSVIDSKDGVHLSTYIKFDGDLISFKNRLNQLLTSVDEHLSFAMSYEEKTHFLKPFKALASDSETLSKFKGNIAIFRKNNFFRFISLPTEIEETAVVADTFHIKPLIKWAQQDQDFILVGLTAAGADIYKGNQVDFKKIDEVVYPDLIKNINNEGRRLSLKEKRLRKAELQNTIEWLARWVNDLTSGMPIMVFVAGPGEFVKPFVKGFRSEKLYPETLSSLYSENAAVEICKNIRALLRLDSREKLYQHLKEFEYAQKMKTAKVNIFQIAKAAIKGKIKKLVIAEDLHVFGKLDHSTGGVSIHPLDLDHEDDCLLDDLAQTVLLKGGEVIVAKRSEIPMGRPIVAVLQGQQHEITLLTPRINEFTV